MSVANREKADCCGCNACAEVCPKNCIEMIPDRKGFLYPQVNQAACIECGACEKACPFEKGNISLNVPFTAYAAWNKDREQYLASSSGGAAHVFSSHIIKQGGVVYGCSSEGIHIRHIRVEALSGLHKLQGSKYVQSDVRGLFNQVKNDLKAGKPVLFIGTPCQVAGLKNYIKRIPEHLYLVDLICHGVPSQQMLHEHITHMLGNCTAEHLSFRKGVIFHIEITSPCGTTYSSEPHKDMYYRAFLDGISYRKSSYHCPFARKERISDITIGDFWGIKDTASLPLEISDGISVLLPSSEKGKALIEAAKPNLSIYERSINEAVAGNSQLRSPVKYSLRVRIFNSLYPLISLEKAAYICVVDQKFRTLFKIINRKIGK